MEEQQFTTRLTTKCTPCPLCDPAQFEKLYQNNWSEWRPFPDPRKCEYLYAPFGPGVYQLRCATTKQMILFGQGKNVAYRMSSLLPKPYGMGTRWNSKKRNFVLENLDKLEYRTMALPNKECAEEFERFIKGRENYIFSETKRGYNGNVYC